MHNHNYLRFHAIGLFILFLSGFCPVTVRAQKSNVLHIEQKELNAGVYFMDLAEMWKYSDHLQDGWTDPSFDDTGWEERSPLAISPQMAGPDGIFHGWFRIKFEFADDQPSDSWYLRWASWAAADIYLDGQPLASFGNTGKEGKSFTYYRPVSRLPKPLNLNRGEIHTLAIFMVDETAWFIRKNLRSNFGDYHSIVQLQNQKAYNRLNQVIHEENLIYSSIRLTASFILLGLFALLFLLDRKDRVLRSILFFIILFNTAWIALTIGNQQGLGFQVIRWVDLMQDVFFSTTIIYVPVLLARILNIKLNRSIRWILIIFLASVLFQILFKNFNLTVIHSPIVLAMCGYLLIRSYKQIHGAAWAVICGLGMTVLLWAYLASVSLFYHSDSFPHVQEYATALTLSFPLSLLVFVAIRFKEKNQSIAEQADAIIALKENEKRLAVEQQQVLEVQVAERTDELRKSLDNLKAAQSQLIQAEKMASLGELTAGIAHEIQNPLNFVNNFSEVNKELIEELKEAVLKNDSEEIQIILKDLSDNEGKVNQHGKRADAIVKSMLQHSRTSSGDKEQTDINVLCDEYLRLAYHGMRARDKSFNAGYKLELDENLPSLKVVPQDIGRVLLNLINNAFQAVTDVEKPEVVVSTQKLLDKIEIKVSDNGPGIPDAIKDKIFQPFYTTKPTGQGTGLGLSLAYDIVKAHGGTLEVESREGQGSTFIIKL